MRKHIARTLVVLAALTVLGGSVPQSAISRHIKADRGGHARGNHCSQNPHRHSKQFYRNEAREQGIKLGHARHQHAHHNHDCKTYPPR